MKDESISEAPLVELRDDPKRAASVLRALVLFIMVLLALSAASSPWMSRSLLRSAIIHGGFFSVTVVTWIALRLDRPRLAGAIMSSGFWLGGTIVVFVVGGVRGPATLVYLPTVFVAGLFWSWNAAAGITAASVVAMLGATVMEQAGYLPMPSTPVTPGRLWMSLAVTISATAALVFIALRAQGEALVERARLKERLARAERMEAVGRLAGGIAHDFNNLLAIIKGNLDLMDRSITDQGLQKSVDSCRESAERAEKLVTQLLAIGRRQPMNPEIIRLDRVIDDHRPLLENLVGDDVDLVIEHGTSRDPVFLDSDQITRVLINLAGNARDAMPNGGTLRITTTDVTFDAEHAREAGVPPGAYVRLTIEDTGVGMDAQTERRAFDPFFTTKEIGRGTGLGLSTVAGIVVQSDGHVALHSTEGEGTQIEILFPKADAPQDREAS